MPSVCNPSRTYFSKDLQRIKAYSPRTISKSLFLCFCKAMREWCSECIDQVCVYSLNWSQRIQSWDCEEHRELLKVPALKKNSHMSSWWRVVLSERIKKLNGKEVHVPCKLQIQIVVFGNFINLFTLFRFIKVSYVSKTVCSFSS